MPDFAHLEVDLRCPRCAAPLTDRVWFQWGYCRGYEPREGELYHPGDRLRWRRCADGSIPAWAYFIERGGEGSPSPSPVSAGANIGDPTLARVIVRDWYQFPRPPADASADASAEGSAEGSVAWGCPACGEEIGGAAVEIRAGRIERAWLYRPGALDERADIFLVADDGALTPMAAWNDHPMATLPPSC